MGHQPSSMEHKHQRQSVPTYRNQTDKRTSVLSQTNTTAEMLDKGGVNVAMKRSTRRKRERRGCKGKLAVADDLAMYDVIIDRRRTAGKHGRWIFDARVASISRRVQHKPTFRGTTSTSHLASYGIRIVSGTVHALEAGLSDRERGECRCRLTALRRIQRGR